MNAHAVFESTSKNRRRHVQTRLATLLYVASAVRIRPRGIDRYIDYFGDRMLGAPSHPGVSGVSVHEEAVTGRRRVS